MDETNSTSTLSELLAPPARLTAMFHMVNRLLPECQEVLSVPPDLAAGKAIAIMKENGYSQLPVKQGHSVLGLFTFRAFAMEVTAGDSRIDYSALPVEEFLEHETPVYARPTDEFRGLIDILDAKDSVVVSGPENLIAILTPLDVLRYLYSIANSFVLIEEIELALRTLIRKALPRAERLQQCIGNALAEKYIGREPPKRLEDMTFDEYIALLRDGRNWESFEAVLGGTRDRARGRLEPVRDLRNDVFHFRRELTVEDHERLANCRDWLLRCIRKVQARGEGVQ